jgi:hypothetical protein
MGRHNAEGFAEAVAEGTCSLRAALSWHLTSNHFPPVPTSMIEPCLEAIEACNEEDWEREIALPGAITFRGVRTAPANAIVEAHHLDSFLGDDDDD